MAAAKRGRRPARGALARKLVQVAAFGFCNAHVRNLLGGTLYAGKWKRFCAPGLNCHSCPAAVLSCPVGALQAVGGSVRFGFSFYVWGLLLAFGVVLGRAVCGFLCPFGLVQEAIGLIPVRKVRLWRPLRWVKYGVLVVFVLVLPVADTGFAGAGAPAFCEYVCPAGTLEAAVPLLLADGASLPAPGWRFALKAGVLLAVIAGCVFVRRFFCKLLCPLGAIYGLLNKVSAWRVRVNPGRCTGCGRCAASCPMDVDPVRAPDSIECIRCGACAHACPEGAIRVGFLPASVPRP